MATVLMLTSVAKRTLRQSYVHVYCEEDRVSLQYHMADTQSLTSLGLYIVYTLDLLCAV